MIQILDKKPDGFFIELSDYYIWFSISDKNGAFGYIAAEIVGEMAALHIEFTRWSHNILKIVLKDWESIKNICKKLGAKKLVASNKNIDDKKWPKFIKILGFNSIDMVLISMQEV